MSSSRKEFKLRLTMLSDWHIGTGAGRPGSVDKLIARDADGFPFVPAKTLNGIWRDAMEMLTLGLDGNKESNGEKKNAEDSPQKAKWSKFVEAIFGVQPNQIDARELATRLAENEKTYSHSLLSIQPARLNQNLRKKILSFDKPNKQKFLSALTFIKPGVAIDENSGTARSDFLRLEEMGRSGTVLEADCELNFENLKEVTEEQAKTIWALLMASAKFVERIGGKRRRGAGKCKLEVVEAKGDEIQHLESFKDKAAPSVPKFKEQAKDNYDLKQVKLTNEWQRLEFSLTLQTPISIVTSMLGNVSESLDFIPGTYLLPHFTKVLGRQLGKGFFSAVAYGDFQVSPATIEVAVKEDNTIVKKRGMPVPKVIYYDKVGGGFDKQKSGRSTVYNLFTESEKIAAGEQKKSYRSGYISSLGEKERLPSFKHPNRTISMHNVIEDKLQRPTEAVGGVFSREAIAAGTILRGEIRLKKLIAEKLNADWHKKLDDIIRLGTSRKDDYGLAQLKILGGPKEIESQASVKDTLTVYLLSDCLLRNENLRQTNLAENLADQICQKLNERVDDESNKICLKRRDSLIQMRRIESWHESWGFPRPTLIAMEAGSCAVFEVDGTLTEDSLREVEAGGIGERCGEGYGQVRFNPPLLTQPINTWTPADKPENGKQAEVFSDSLVVDDFVKQIEETVWREELKVAVLKAASNKEKRKEIFGFDSDEKVPPMSQVGGLRSVISRLQRSEDRDLVLSWLEHLQGTKNRIEKWARGEADAKNKIKRIVDLIENENEARKVWTLLGKDKDWQEPTRLTSRDLKQKFWAEAVRSIFFACARAHKRDLEKGQEDN